MLGHALADSRQLLQFVRIFRQLLDRFVHSGNKLRGFLIAAVAAANSAIDVEELRGVAEYAGNALVVHKFRDYKPIGCDRGGQGSKRGKVPAVNKSRQRESLCRQETWRGEIYPLGFCTLA